MTKEEIEREIDKEEYTIFMLEMADRLDDLDRKLIAQHTARVNDLRRELAKVE